jgi:OmpA-OmpF porin, OOP family
MKFFLSTFFFIAILSTRLCLAQNTIGYFFENNLKASDASLPNLVILGRQGVYVQDALPELEGMKKTAYQFERNCGLQFDNADAGGFIKDSYTIEVYFRFDKLNSWKRVIDFKNRKTDWGCYIFNGKLNFYNLLVSEKSPVNENEYTHYVISRDGNTNTVKIYADGVSKIEFDDSQKHAAIDEDQKLNFFFDDLKVTDEASAGAVVMIKISNYVISSEKIKTNFDALLSNITTIPPQPKFTPSLPDSTTAIAHSITNFTVQNSETQAPISEFTYILQNASGIVGTGNSNNQASASINYVPESKLYITIKSKGYVSLEDTITTGEVGKATNLKFMLNPIKVGQTVTLKTLQFARGQFELLPASYGELDKLVEFMNENPSMEIELNGHTDNQGDPKLNLELSENRVKSTKDYIVSKGIDKNRIKGKGFGGSSPIASNAKEETRMLNRRVEMTIIKN